MRTKNDLKKVETEAEAMAKFFYGFMPMDDYPVGEAISYLADDIKKMHDTDGLYEYMLNAYLGNHKNNKIYDSNLNSIVSKLDKENDTYEYHGKKTPQGVPYVNIAKFLLSMADMGLLSDFDDNTHYNKIGKALETAPENVIYILSCATETMLK